MVVDSPSQLVQAFLNDIGSIFGSAVTTVRPDCQNGSATIAEQVILQTPVPRPHYTGFFGNDSMSSLGAQAQARPTTVNLVDNRGLSPLAAVAALPIAVGAAGVAGLSAAESKISNLFDGQKPLTTNAQTRAVHLAQARNMMLSPEARAMHLAQAQGTYVVAAPQAQTQSIYAMNASQVEATYAMSGAKTVQSTYPAGALPKRAGAPAKSSVCQVCMAGGDHESAPLMSQAELVGDWKLVYTTMPNADLNNDYVIRVRRGKGCSVFQMKINGTKINGNLRPEADGSFSIHAMNMKVGTAKFQRTSKNQVKITSLNKDYPYIWVVESVHA